MTVDAAVDASAGAMSVTLAVLGTATTARDVGVRVGIGVRVRVGAGVRVRVGVDDFFAAGRSTATAVKVVG